MVFRIGRKAIAKEGLHIFPIGDTIEFVEDVTSIYPELEETVYEFKSEDMAGQHLVEEEFEWIEEN